VLKVLLKTIVNVLLKTLNSMNNHGIDIVIVNTGSVMNLITLQIVVNYLFNAWTTVKFVLMRLAVICVLMTTIIMVIIVNTKILTILYAWKVVILVILLVLLLVINVLSDTLILMVFVKWI